MDTVPGSTEAGVAAWSAPDASPAGAGAASLRLAAGAAASGGSGKDGDVGPVGDAIGGLTT